MLGDVMKRGRSRCGVALIGMVAGTMIFSSDAHADRRSSLNGNALIQDQDDSFVFPQLLGAYGSRLTLDYGVSDQQGSGLFAWKFGNTTLGMGLNRGTIHAPTIRRSSELDALGFPALPIQSTQDVTPGAPGDYVVDPATFTAVDLLLSAGRVGFRLGLGGSGDVYDGPNGQSGSSHTFITLGGGYGFEAGKLRLDAAGNLLMDFGKILEDGATQFNGSLIRFGLDGRGYYEVGEKLDLGLLASIDIRRQAMEASSLPNNPAMGAVSFGTELGAGPVWKLPRNTTAAAYAVLGVDTQTIEPDSSAKNNQANRLTVTLPGVRAAFETGLLDWLYLRGGARYDYNFDSYTYQKEANGVDSSVRRGGFSWDAGLGLDFNYVRVDGTFGHGFLTNGPSFVSGASTAPGLFGIVSMTLNIESLENYEKKEAAPSPDSAEDEAERKTPEDAPEQEEREAQGQQPQQQQRQVPEQEPQGQPQQGQQQQQQVQQQFSESPAPVVPETTQAEPEDIFEPIFISFDDSNPQLANDDTTTGTYAQGWELWYDGTPWGSGHVVEVKDGEQAIEVELGSYGLKRSFENISGRTLKLQHRFTGEGYYEVMADDEVLVRYTEPTYRVDELEIPSGTKEIKFKVGSLTQGSSASVTLMSMEIR